jgi:hypothetical protein
MGDTPAVTLGLGEAHVDRAQPVGEWADQRSPAALAESAPGAGIDDYDWSLHETVRLARSRWGTSSPYQGIITVLPFAVRVSGFLPSEPLEASFQLGWPCGQGGYRDESGNLGTGYRLERGSACLR